MEKTTSYLNSWLIGEKYPYLVSGLNSAVVGNKIYCFGGKTRTGYINKLLYYDTNDNTWTEKTGNLVYEGIGVASIDEKIYCFGGCDSGLASTSGYCYDTINDSWESIKGFDSGNNRSHMAIGVINNLIYIAGGDNGGAAYYATTYCYDPVVNTMTTKTSMTAQRCRLASSVLDNMLYCIGGYYDGNAYKTNYCYDPSTDTWTTKTSIPDVRRDLNSGVINGKIYCIGGSLQTVASSLDNNYCYDPSTNTWTTKKPIPTNRKTFALESVGNLIYCIGGHSGDQDYPVPTNEIYIPD